MSIVSSLLVLGGALFALQLITQAVSKRLGDKYNLKPKTQTVSRYVIGSILLLMVFADEMVGRSQFKALCGSQNEHVALSYSQDNITGRSLTVNDSSLSSRKLKTAVPITAMSGQWRDAKTDEVIVEYKLYRASGGWLSRLVGLTADPHPYTFDGFCGPQNHYQTFQYLNVRRA